jgi:hypothetical protein
VQNKKQKIVLFAERTFLTFYGDVSAFKPKEILPNKLKIFSPNIIILINKSRED